MRAVRNTAEGIVVAQVDDPELTADSTSITVRSSSICGSDIHLLQFGALPFTLGHEFAGLTASGKAVAVDPNVPCGTCDQCDSGFGHRCRTATHRILGIGADGGMADSVAVRKSALIELPPTLRIEDACLVEPLGVATHGMRQAQLVGGERVAVVGAGSIGLAAVAAARPRASEVGLAARHRHQQIAGERLGAHDATGEYDVVIECAGTASALERATELCRPGGLVLFLSTLWDPVPIPGFTAMAKELGFRWSFTYGKHEHGHDLQDAAQLLANNSEIATTLVTHRFPIVDAKEAFRVANDRAAGAIKVVIEP